MPLSRSETTVSEFLADTAFADARHIPLAGDASPRRYDRLIRADGETAILMIAASGSLGPFLNVDRQLRALGLSAPKVLAGDEHRGLMLFEDLGDALFAQVVQSDPSAETPLYRAAVEVLVHLHRQATPADLRAIPATELAEMAALVCDWYVDTSATDRAVLVDALTTALMAIEPMPPVMALRDYHAENLIWLPDRKGIARVGLLDFQDAFLGHPAYDLVSLLRDARRDVSPGLTHAMIQHYCDQTGTDPQTFGRAFATLGVQRNLRILGVFTRLSLQSGKPHYVDLIPRVWRNLSADLAHPDVSDLRRIIQDMVPEPTPRRLADLRK